MKSIDYKIAKSEAEWRRYRYENIGVREGGKMFGDAIKRSVKKRYYCLVKNVSFHKKRAAFRASYDENKENVIVSLTSTRQRISNIFPTIYSLLAQTHKPDLIILWLGNDNDYPKNVISKIEAMGIVIKYREDLGPNTKYHYAFMDYKKDIIITVDDDIIYHEEMIEELYGTYVKHPDLVIARRVNKMRFDADKNLVNYKDFIWEYKDAYEPSFDLLATGVGGVLYPPEVTSLDCWENRDYLEVCPKCDDIWLKFGELINGVKVYAVGDSKFYLDVINNSSQKTNLATDNIDNGKNDERIRACAQYFGIIDDLCGRVLAD